MSLPAAHGAAWLERGLAAIALLAVLLAAAAAVVPAAPPLQDLPEWLYQGWLLKGILLGDEQAQNIARLTPFPVPNAVMQIALTGLNFAVPPLIAGKILVLGYLALGYATIHALTRRAQPAVRGSLQALLVLSVLLSQRFWNGYVAYQLGLLMLAWLLLRTEPLETEHSPRARPALLAWIGVGLFFSHATIYAAFLTVIGLAVLRSRQLRELWSALPSLVLAAWYAIGSYVRGNVGGEAAAPLFMRWLASLVEAVPYKLYTAAKWGPFVNFYEGPKNSALQQLPALYWAGVALDVAFGAGLLLLVAWASYACGRELVRRSPLACAVSAVFFAGFAALPFSHLLGVANLGERLFGVAVVAGLVAFSALTDPRVVWPTRALAGLAALALPYLAVPFFVVRDAPRPGEPSVFADWLTEYYTDQVYFNSRPNQMVDKVAFLRSLAARSSAGEETAPDLFFETSLLVRSSTQVSAGQVGQGTAPAAD